MLQNHQINLCVKETMFELSKSGYNFTQEDVLRIMEDKMKRHEILSKYKVHQGGGIDKRYYVYINGKKSKRFTHKCDLENWLVNMEKENIPKNPTIEDIYDGWIAIRHKKADGTYKKDIYNYNHYIKDSILSQKPLKDIDIDDGYQWFDHCKDIKPNMRKKYFDGLCCTLNSMFEYAIQKKYIQTIPFSKPKIDMDLFTDKIKHYDAELIYSDEEVQKVKQLAKEKAAMTNESKYLAPIIFFNLGIRDGELLALKWDDLNLQKQNIHIHSELVEKVTKEGKHDGYKWVAHTKTPKGDRILKLNSEMIQTFQLIKKYNLKSGYPIGPDDFILMRHYKKSITHCTPRTIYTLIKKYCVDLNMSSIKSPHDMRRTCFTNLFYAGMKPKQIQIFAGHSSLNVTLDYIKHKDDEDIDCYLEAII